MPRLIAGFAVALVLAADACGDPTDVEFLPCVAPTSITIGSTIDGTLSANECNLRGDGPTDGYTFTLTEFATVKFSVTNTSLAGSIKLHEGASLTDAAEVYTVSLTQPHYAVLHAGTYAVEFHGDGDHGNYRLTTEKVDVPEGCVSGNVPDGPHVFVMTGITRSTTLTTSDCQVSLGNFIDHYEMMMEAGKTYDITASSLTPGLGLSLEVGVPDGHGGLTQIQAATSNTTVHIVAAPTTTGLHVINVIETSTSGVRTGNYQLKILKP